jgi:hypothetical protein
MTFFWLGVLAAFGFSSLLTLLLFVIRYWAKK